ncbi:MAG: hypothetical protein NTW82_04065 [Bacteroidia bacterium]|nr:hypothetical protein [Bacteroidia bacterium]
MKNNKSNIRLFLAGAMAVISSFTLSAQEDATSDHALYTSLGLGNNMVYMGSSISGDKPYYFGSLTYGFKEKLYASVSSFHLSAFDPFLAFNTFSLNYSHTVNSWFDLSAGVSRYQVNSELTDTLFNRFFYGDLTLGFDWKILYTKLSAGGVFSESSGLYLQMRNSRYFQTPQFFNDKAYISFDPNVNMLFGTLTETTTSSGTTTGVTQPFSSKKSSGKNPSGTTTKEFFSLMEVDLGVPVAFNMGRVTVEVDPGFIIPLYSDTDPLNPKGFSLLLSCYVKIF